MTPARSTSYCCTGCRRARRRTRSTQAGFERRHPRGGKPLLTYLRYNAQFDEAWLKDKLKLTLDGKQLASIAEMDRAENMDTLVQIGKAASVLIEDRHFGRGFDIE
jgi:hypothetical protein